MAIYVPPVSLLTYTQAVYNEKNRMQKTTGSNAHKAASDAAIGRHDAELPSIKAVASRTLPFTNHWNDVNRVPQSGRGLSPTIAISCGGRGQCDDAVAQWVGEYRSM